MTRRGFNTILDKQGKNEAIKTLSERILHNACTTRYILRHCAQNNILHYRLSSSLFPLITDDATDVCIEDLPDCTQIKEELHALQARLRGNSTSQWALTPINLTFLASANNLDAVR